MCVGKYTFTGIKTKYDGNNMTLARLMWPFNLLGGGGGGGGVADPCVFYVSSHWCCLCDGSVLWKSHVCASVNWRPLWHMFQPSCSIWMIVSGLLIWSSPSRTFACFYCLNNSAVSVYLCVHTCSYIRLSGQCECTRSRVSLISFLFVFYNQILNSVQLMFAPIPSRKQIASQGKGLCSLDSNHLYVCPCAPSHYTVW